MEPQPPVWPGDLIVFHVSGNRFLVIQAGAAEHGEQLIGGLITSDGELCKLVSMSLVLSGYPAFWSIQRPVE